MSKKKVEYKQLDIMAALRGKEIFVEDPLSKFIEEDKKKKTIFDIVNDIKWEKTGKCLDTEDGKQAFLSFLVIKILSLDPDICERLNFCQKYIEILDKEQMYKLLLAVVPKKKSFEKKITKLEPDNLIPFIANYFECSIKEAKEYKFIMGPEWTELFIKKCGDFIHE